MKFIKLLFVSVAIFILSIYLTAFRHMDRPSAMVTYQYIQHMKDLSSAMDDLSVQSRHLDNSKKSVLQLRISFSAARLAYKKVEFILAWIDPEFVKDFINGAPLPRLERKAPGPFIVEPEGFQVIEEIIFSDEPWQKKSELEVLSQKLRNHVAPLAIERKPFTEMTVLEASRMGLIRIMSHGITGFDTPAASENALIESTISLKSIHEAVACFYPFIPKERIGLKDSIDSNFVLAISYLESSKGFEKFDRIVFIREYVNPLYGYLLDLHLALGLETVYEVKKDLPATNYFSRDIFSDDFMDVRYFTKLRNPDRKELIDLGRMLFFDPVLSSNNQRSCASCHNPEKGFTDGKAKSTAFNFDGTVDRNSPTLINAVFANRYFYDMRADFLEKQMEHVVVNHKEFNTSYPELFEKLKASPEYTFLFKQAFPDFGEHYISKNTVSSAMSAYVASLNGFNSEFDKYIRKENSVIGEDVKRGFNLFMGKAGCATCHFAPLFNGTVPPIYDETESEVLGVPTAADLKNTSLDKDQGRAKGMLKEDSPIYKNSFKTPTVRNIALTAPYMHNGVFGSLEEVMDFYNKGGGQGIGLDVPNQTLPPDKLKLSKKEISDIIAFMNSLTDTTGLTQRPLYLPTFPEDMNLGQRTIGGVY